MAGFAHRSAASGPGKLKAEQKTRAGKENADLGNVPSPAASNKRGGPKSTPVVVPTKLGSIAIPRLKLPGTAQVADQSRQEANSVPAAPRHAKQCARPPLTEEPEAPNMQFNVAFDLDARAQTPSPQPLIGSLQPKLQSLPSQPVNLSRLQGCATLQHAPFRPTVLPGETIGSSPAQVPAPSLQMTSQYLRPVLHCMAGTANDE